MPADVRQQAIDIALLRNPTAVHELPDAPQDAGGDVEPAVAQFVAIGGKVEQARGFGVDLDAPGAVVD